MSGEFYKGSKQGRTEMQQISREAFSGIEFPNPEDIDVEIWAQRFDERVVNLPEDKRRDVLADAAKLTPEAKADIEVLLSTVEEAKKIGALESLLEDARTKKEVVGQQIQINAKKAQRSIQKPTAADATVNRALRSEGFPADQLLYGTPPEQQQ
jgi:hypothetical protein